MTHLDAAIDRAKELVLVLALCCGTTASFAQAGEGESPCGALRTNHYGPYDYRTERGKLVIVEQFHFNAGVEQLIRGQTGILGKDLNYVLRASPNHHRALASVMRWSDRLKSRNLPDMEFSVDCWFERALRFAPEDHIVRSLYASYAARWGQKDVAIAQLDAALKLVGDNPVSIYNIGLVFFEIGAPVRALEQAHRAMGMGLQRTELREMLLKAGKWEDPKP